MEDSKKIRCRVIGDFYDSKKQICRVGSFIDLPEEQAKKLILANCVKPLSVIEEDPIVDVVLQQTKPKAEIIETSNFDSVDEAIDSSAQNLPKIEEFTEEQIQGVSEILEPKEELKEPPKEPPKKYHYEERPRKWGRNQDNRK